MLGGSYLYTSSGVLGCAACYQVCVTVLEKVLIKAHVFLLREDGVVGFEAIFLEHGCISASRLFYCC